MKSVSSGTIATRGSEPRPRALRLFALPGVLAVLAVGIAGFAFVRAPSEVRAQDCPPGTLPFTFQAGIPSGSLDLSQVPPDLLAAAGVTITITPGSEFDLVVVVACISESQVPPGSLPGTTLLFTTPTPGAPVRFQTPTNTPPPTATSVPATATAPAGALVTGIRPPSTGDAGLLGGAHTRPAPGDPSAGSGQALKVAATFALFVLGGGLAIGASFLGGLFPDRGLKATAWGTVPEPSASAGGMGVSTPAGARTYGRSPSIR